ncbi:MAG: hypothetical protein ACRELA_23600 [Candidatus Rokuibacteriota bacterium]
MIDMIGAIAGTAVYAVLVGVLVGFSPVGGPTRLAAFAAAAGWGGIIVAVAALGGFAPGATGPFPAPVFAFVGFLTLLFGGWFLLPRFRSALLSVPLPALVGLNAARLGGVFFLILAADGRLSAPFAPVAGAGDMVVAVLAIPLAAMAARGAQERPAWLGAWNALGALDLIIAVSLGLLSAPNTPFRVFTEGPGTLAMTALPWIMVPAILVPLYLLVHFTIAVKLRSLPPVTSERLVSPVRVRG